MTNTQEAKTIQPTPYTLSLFPSGQSIPKRILDQVAVDCAGRFKNAEAYPDIYHEHLEKSQNFILESAQGLTGSAAILGVGNASDIPLEELAVQFESLTLIELDQQSVIKAVQRLPSNLQSKCHIIVDDLSGSIAESHQAMMEALELGNDAYEYFQTLAGDIDYLSTQPLQLGQSHDFIVSSLVTSQLHRISLSQIDIAAYNIYQFNHSVDKPQYFTNQISKFASRLQREHFEMIRDNLKPTGRAYWSDTMDYQGKSLFNRTIPIGQTLVDAAQLDLFTKDFDITEERQWTWGNARSEVTYNVLARNMQLTS